MSDYSQEVAKQAKLVGENQPVSSSIDVLGSWKMLMNLDQLTNEDGRVDPNMRAAVNEELMYLKSGIQAQQNNPWLKANYGSGLLGASLIAQDLQRLKQKNEYEKLLSSYVPKEAPLGRLFSEARPVVDGIVGAPAVENT